MHSKQKRIFRLCPLPVSDPRWDITQRHGVVIVRASSPAHARVFAIEEEMRALGVDGDTPRGAAVRRASAFSDGHAYTVEIEESGRFQASGPDEVLLVEGPRLDKGEILGSTKRHKSAESS